MRLPTSVATAVIVGSALASAGFSGSALAEFPDFSDCPREVAGVEQCIALQSSGGSLAIDGTEIPLGASLQVRGGLAGSTLVAPTGGSPIVSQPVAVPGGLVRGGGSSSLNRLTVELKLAGGPIAFDRGTLTLRAPVKLKVRNPVLGACRIGSDSDPVTLSLTVGRTSPPPPNAPIEGAVGSLSFEEDHMLLVGNRYVDNAFGVPATSGCGPVGNALVDHRLGLPSPAGTNAIVVDNDIALTYGL